MAPATFPEVVAEHVGAACVALAVAENEIAIDAMLATDPARWPTLEWIVESGRLDRCGGVWPRSIACYWVAP